MAASRRPAAFTLIELLVVITIIGMLMALLLPAITSSSGAANTIDCRNNVQNLAKAIQQFEANLGRYPGYAEQIGTGNVTGTWIVAIFDYYDRKDVSKAWESGAKPEPQIDSLICKDDPPEQAGGPSTSYVGNAGKVGTADADERPSNGIMHDMSTLAKRRSRRTRKSHIKDGITQTLLVTENIQATNWSALGKQATVFVWHPTTSPSADMQINGNKKAGLSAITAERARPSSWHTGDGVNAAFVDTHAIWLSQSIDYKVYQQLMTPHGAASDMPDKNVIINDGDLR